MLRPEKLPPIQIPGCRHATHHAQINLSAQGGKIPAALTIYLTRGAWVDLTNDDKIPHHVRISPPDILGGTFFVILPNQTIRLQTKQIPVSQPEHGMIVDATARPPLEHPIILCPS